MTNTARMAIYLDLTSGDATWKPIRVTPPRFLDQFKSKMIISKSLIFNLTETECDMMFIIYPYMITCEGQFSWSSTDVAPADINNLGDLIDSYHVTGIQTYRQCFGDQHAGIPFLNIYN